MGTVKVTNIEPIADNGTVTLGGSGDTITLGSGATVTGNGLVGITEADQWRLSANYSYTTTGTVDLTANWERSDTSGFSKIGTGMTESSGIFSFPSTGIYRISAFSTATASGGSRDNIQIRIFSSIDNFSTETASAYSYDSANTSSYAAMSAEFFFDVTDISTHKVKLSVRAGGNTIYAGSTTFNWTSMTFIRLGDT